MKNSRGKRNEFTRQTSVEHLFNSHSKRIIKDFFRINILSINILDFPPQMNDDIDY